MPAAACWRLVLRGLHSTIRRLQAPGGDTKRARAGRSANMQLAIEYMKLGKLATARDCIERALKRGSREPERADDGGSRVRAAERNAEGGARLSDRRTPGQAAIRTFRTAMPDFLCRTGKTAAGEKLFAEVARNPLYQTPEVALVNAGVCVRGAGDVVDAERYFNRALAIRPNMPEACCSWAMWRSTAAMPRRRSSSCSAISR